MLEQNLETNNQQNNNAILYNLFAGNYDMHDDLQVINPPYPTIIKGNVRKLIANNLIVKFD